MGNKSLMEGTLLLLSQVLTLFLPVASGERRDETMAWLPWRGGLSAVTLRNNSTGRVDQLPGDRPCSPWPPYWGVGSSRNREEKVSFPPSPTLGEWTVQGTEKGRWCRCSLARQAQATVKKLELCGYRTWASRFPLSPCFSCRWTGNHLADLLKIPSTFEKFVTLACFKNNMRSWTWEFEQEKCHVDIQ